MKSTGFLDEIRGLDVAKLREQATALREELFKLRVRKKTSAASEQGHRMGEARKKLARVLTVLAQKKA